jgi:hypothetical protein
MSNNKGLIYLEVAAVVLMTFLALPSFAAKDSFTAPKEFGVYAKTEIGIKRITPNIVSEEQGIFFLESNKPQRFSLGTIEYFIIFGNFQMKYLTLNPLKPFQMSALGIPRFMFGKEMEITLTKKGENLYTVKPKGLFGRGYYSLWIEDTAWDFLIE